MNKNKKDLKVVDSGDGVVIYTDDKGNTELRADVLKETVWATQEQMADVFDSSKQTISRHLINIFKDRELESISVVKESLTTASDGKQYVTKLYNLDAIIAVGYRVNSIKATQFRIWATKILREYVLKGYSLNNRLITKSPEKLEGLQEAINLVESTGNPGRLKGKITIKLTKNLEAK